jgi:hypothetical protein
MAVAISRLTETDIPGVIDTIQQAFADDPYSRWIYDDREKVPLYTSHSRHSRTFQKPSPLGLDPGSFPYESHSSCLLMRFEVHLVSV